MSLPVGSWPFRFWNKVERKEGQRCWLWTGAKNSDGYGNFRLDGRPLGAHRISWQIRYGDIPAGMVVMHLCDTRACVNPWHMRLGTQTENIRDMDRKGRRIPAAGVVHGRAKLSEAQVREIRTLSAQGATNPALAVRFSVGVTAIQKIVRRENWSHIP